MSEITIEEKIDNLTELRAKVVLKLLLAGYFVDEYKLDKAIELAEYVPA